MKRYIYNKINNKYEEYLIDEIKYFHLIKSNFFIDNKNIKVNYYFIIIN